MPRNTDDDGTALDLDWLISVDDHILEPPNLWVDRVAAKDRDRAPHMETDDDGVDCWVYDGKRYPTSGLSAVAGKSKEEFSPEPLTYAEMRPGCYDAMARLEDMDRAGILASLCFPTITRFCGQLFMEASDREFGFICLQVYNDWLIEEWCGAAPGRYIPLMLIPMWDPHARRQGDGALAAKGVTTFAFSENPAPLGLPTIHDKDRYWDPVMAAANELGMVASMHVGSSSQVPQIAPDSPFMANLAWGAIRTSGTMLSWLFSGHVPALPEPQDRLVRGRDRLDAVLPRARRAGARQATALGEEGRNSSWTTRQPTSTSTRSTSGRRSATTSSAASSTTITASTASTRSARTTSCARPTTRTPTRRGPTASTSSANHRRTSRGRQYKLLRGNAERLYRFTPAEPPVLANGRRDRPA